MHQLLKKLNDVTRRNILVLLLFVIFYVGAGAFEVKYGVQYSNKSIIRSNVALETTENIYTKTSLFVNFYTFNTEGVDGQNKNRSHDVGLKYDILKMGKNTLSIILSYYKVTSYNKLLHFTEIDEIYDKLKAGLMHNYDNSFLIGVFYNKFYDSYKNSLNFFVEKTLFENEYIKSCFGYKYYKNINISNNNTILYNYNNIQNILRIRELLNEEDALYWSAKLSFAEHINVLINIKTIYSRRYGKYSTVGLAFGLNTS
jgi:hypothetical protein